MPLFHGKYEQWLPFREDFTSLIDNRDDLTDVEKLHYLKGALKGQAAEKLRNLTPVGENYQRAWTILEMAYSDKRLIISNHMNLILKMPALNRETSEGLQKLADDTIAHKESLASLGIIVTEEILVQNLQNKLPKNTADKWEDMQKRSVFPKLEELIEFIYSRAARLNKDSGDKHSASTDNSSFHSSHKGKQKSQTFLTNSKYNKCQLCQDSHFLYRCVKFKQLPIQNRVQVAKNSGVCLLCLRVHVGKACKFEKCMICERKENYLLHEHVATARD